MLSMILADDEPIITKGIQKLLNWEQLGIKIIGAFENGQQALHSILTNEPDIAILDISMPGRTGIEILKEISAAQCKTKVIFLSGFQEFEYAQAALRFGAADYLLKPVKRDSLVSAIGKCAQQTGHAGTYPANTQGRNEMPPEAYKKLVQDKRTNYILVAVHPIGLESKSDMERQLIQFSAFGLIEECVENQDIGIAFQRGDKTYIVLKGVGRSAARGLLLEIKQKIQDVCGCNLGFVMGPTVSGLQNIASCATQCAGMLGYFYFYDYLESPVLETGRPVYTGEYTDNDIRALRDGLLMELFLQNREKTVEKMQQYLNAVCRISGNRSDTAVYYLLSCIRAVEDRLEAIDVQPADPVAADTVKKLQSAADYTKLTKHFESFIFMYYDTVSSAMQKDEKRDIINAKRYIEEHYAENISLETMAKQIHMNSFYFSSFFKKQTGQNFKDYLNQVRMKHALDLLIKTQKKSYEIAEDVGFKDYRYFSELFSRFYGKTPAAYRKQQKENQ